ncbi:WW domain-binding protein 4-like [Oopsacas minuta]|uniref:WW domain-binding protein 4-like n=1 Tax=Oopsacas minuta TaxID=111878 RepID=A0AAV7JJ90_9METZ|nr:WW domain-binding protein 4-like [Oopsacas minuta]
MSEKWKSLPRKYCEICKCWFGDNKASLAHHEGGKNHKDNVAKYLKEVRIRSAKKNEEEKLAKKFFAHIDEAALASYHQDIMSGVAKPDSQKKRTVPSKLQPSSPKQEPSAPMSFSPKQEAHETTCTTKHSNKTKFLGSKSDKKKDSSNSIFIPPAKKIKPDPDSRTHPYGMWLPVEEPKENTSEIIEQYQEELIEPLEFTERTIQSILPSQEHKSVEFNQGFKSKKRNFRRATDDD